MANEEMDFGWVSSPWWPRVEGFIELTPQPPRDWPLVTIEMLQEVLVGLHRL